MSNQLEFDRDEMYTVTPVSSEIKKYPLRWTIEQGDIRVDKQGIEAVIVSYGKRIAECERTGKVDLQYPNRLYLRGSDEYEHALRSWRAAKAFYEGMLKKETNEEVQNHLC